MRDRRLIATVKAAAVPLTTLMLGGCAGVPVAVTAASLYVDSVLFLRTNKTSTDHILSAVVDRDCAMLNILSEGRICKDAPPPPLIVAVMREVKNVPLDSYTITATTAADPARVEVAEAPTVLTDAMPAAGAAPLPSRKPAAPGAMADPVASPPMPAPSVGAIAQAALRQAPTAERHFLVVVGSFAKRDQAEAHRARFGHPDADIVEAMVRGRTYHRVVLPPGERAEALRQIAMARATGVRDAWLLPWSGRISIGTAVAALPYIGSFYRM